MRENKILEKNKGLNHLILLSLIFYELSLQPDKN